VCVRKVLLYLFHCKARLSGNSLESPGRENICQVPVYRAEVFENHDARKAVFGYSLCLKVKRGYISAHKLKSERLKSFAVSI